MTRSLLLPGLADVHAAANRIHGFVDHTPLLGFAPVPGLALKAEHRQRGGSFKARGAAGAVLGTGAPAVGLVAGSSGNHGIAVAALGRRLGVPVTVVMAAGASAAKAAAMRRLGARIVTVAGGVTDRDRRAREHAELTGAVLVPSSDDALVVAGAGTVALEILHDRPDVDVVFVPTGGGGLLAGVCLAVGDRPVRVVGVEPADGRRYARSLAAGHAVELPPPDTVADGLRAQRPGELTLPIIARRVDELLGVTDDEITAAQRMLRAAGVEAEPSGAVALAGALQTGTGQTGIAARAVAVVSGGNTPAALAAADPTDPIEMETS